MLTLCRPAVVTSDEHRLDGEFAATRWTHHRLLDFEFQHQKHLDDVANEIVPGIVRVGRILARLARRARRAERSASGSWYPNPRPELAKALRARLEEMRKVRNSDPRWKAALRWADERVGDPIQPRRRRAKPAHKVKRRKTETSEAFAKRFALLTTDEDEQHYAEKVASAPRRSRRDQYRVELYREIRVYWSTWNALVRSVDQARNAVLKSRKKGIPADLRRPKFRDSTSLCSEAGGFRIVDRGATWEAAEVSVGGKVVDCFPRHKLEGRKLPEGASVRLLQRRSPWWTVEMRIGTGDEWLRVRVKADNWHELSDDVQVETAKLTRRKDGERWSYSLSLTFDVDKDGHSFSTEGLVAFDWGHREHGHPRASEGIRAWTWRGSDGHHGEILIPAECRRALDEIDACKSRLDTAFLARKKARALPDRNRHGYRRRLMRSGVRTFEETMWLRWETRLDRRMSAQRARIENLRREVYTKIIRELRKRYAVFAFEDESVDQMKRHQKDELKRRQRANRDLATRYEFVSLCERFGARILTVPARNTTRECPDCGALLAKNGPELIVVCPGCGTARDKDEGADRVILTRAEAALASDVA